MIKLSDNLYKNASKQVKQKMIEVFDKSFIFEYRFFNDAYNLYDFYKI